jgi:hypothetical protein
LGTATGKFIPAKFTLTEAKVNNPILVLDHAPEATRHYVERGSVSLNEVLEKLRQHNRVVISGLPGIGKSEIGSQIVHKVRATGAYRGIFWFSAATEAILHAGIREAASAMRLLDDACDIYKVRKLVLDELETHDHWLMVFDNVDDVSLIQNFLPFRDGARHVLITTRYREAHSAINGIPIHIEAMSDQEANALFEKVNTRVAVEKRATN